MSPADVARYTQNPKDLLAPGDAAAGAGAVVNRIRNFLLASPEMVEILGAAMRIAAGEQAQTLGVGLAAAAQICAHKNPGAAQKIQLAVLEANNNDLAKAFAAATGDQPVFALSSGPASQGLNLGLGAGGGLASRGNFRSPDNGGLGGFLPYNTNYNSQASLPGSSRSSSNGLRSVSGSR